MTTRVDNSVVANSLVSADSRLLYSVEFSSHFRLTGRLNRLKLPLRTVLVELATFSGAIATTPSPDDVCKINQSE